MLRIWRGVHNVVSRTPLWLLRKLQLRASYSNSNPCGTYILTDAGECTFQLSFQEAHISLGRPSLAASVVLAPRQVMPQRNRGRWLSCKAFLFRKIDPFVVRLEPFAVGGRGGRGGSCVAGSYFIGPKSSIINLFDSGRSSGAPGVAVCRNVILLQITSVWDYSVWIAARCPRVK